MCSLICASFAVVKIHPVVSGARRVSRWRLHCRYEAIYEVAEQFEAVACAPTASRSMHAAHLLVSAAAALPRVAVAHLVRFDISPLSASLKTRVGESSCKLPRKDPALQWACGDEIYAVLKT